MIRRLDRVIIALCITEIVNWGALYYSLPAAVSFIGADTGWSPVQITGVFSAGLLLSALAGIWAGRLLDRFGARTVMTAGSALATAGLVVVSAAPSLPVFLLGWLMIGLAQAAVLYQPAFTVIGRHYGARRDTPLLLVVLVAGLASTVFVPLTTELIRLSNWRTSYLILTIGLAVITIPLHALLLPHRWPPVEHHPGPPPRRPWQIIRSRPFWMLQTGVTLIAFGLYAVTLNLIPLLTGRGMSESLAALTFGLVGVGQILGRLAVTFLAKSAGSRSRPALIGMASAVLLGLLAIIPEPETLLIVVAVVVGAARGALTLAQATAVADRWGTHALGILNGAFGAPITAATALAPVAGVILATLTGSYALGTAILATVVLIGAAFAALSDRVAVTENANR